MKGSVRDCVENKQTKTAFHTGPQRSKSPLELAMEESKQPLAHLLKRNFPVHYVLCSPTFGQTATSMGLVRLRETIARVAASQLDCRVAFRDQTDDSAVVVSGVATCSLAPTKNDRT